MKQFQHEVDTTIAGREDEEEMAARRQKDKRHKSLETELLQLQEVRQKNTQHLEQVSVELNNANKAKLALEKSKKLLETEHAEMDGVKLN